ncbi:MAG TPA: hypothetical protein VFV67_30350 [Actinophytocola sp.]|uniref:hypothetical protein n=1 Tax=Actinophytocola sp. TaxID=1872138 RepID=UPI002DB9977D|nr:hypothetical protein [Actinophytocola sp.]HEU5474966.1 hypothetical protein [Actinophytocola sp.]
MTAALDRARAIADAVLYEGYLLYPYRAAAAKNQVRWQWGVLMPPGYAAGGTGEHSWCGSELLVEPGEHASLHVRLRFLQVQARTVEIPDGTGYRPVPSITADGVEHTSWEEAVEREVDAVLRFADLLGADRRVPFHVDGGEDVEPIPGPRRARLVRRRNPLSGELSLRAEPLPGPFGGLKLRLRVTNTSTWHLPQTTRAAALHHGLIATHVLLSVSAGSFLSLLDPPEWASVAAAECVNDRIWPVLVGDPDRRDTVLCSPIILYDHPVIAAESPGDLFDGTEIDEILTLRTMTLTDAEKHAARATDDRAAELIDRVDNLPAELLERLHGSVRYLRSITAPTPEEPADLAARPELPWWDPGADASVSPQTDTVRVSGVEVGRGARVRLQPHGRADAHDMFLAGRTALVHAVLLDVDGERYLAVTVEDDPGAELFAAHGRYRYFRPDEVEPL